MDGRAQTLCVHRRPQPGGRGLLPIVIAVVVGAWPGEAAEPAQPRGSEAADRYGYSPDHPIKVGGVTEGRGPRNERDFLQRLRGPNGERVRHRRLQSCCFFKTPNGPIGQGGLLDRYEVAHDGLKELVILYLNMYDHAKPRAPEGFTLQPDPVGPQT